MHEKPTIKQCKSVRYVSHLIGVRQLSYLSCFATITWIFEFICDYDDDYDDKLQAVAASWKISYQLRISSTEYISHDDVNLLHDYARQ